MSEFAVTAPQYNFLTHNFIFNEINAELVGVKLISLHQLGIMINHMKP